MSNTPHTLQQDFPSDAQRISELKAGNAHFARILGEYDQANDAVHRAETRVDAVTEAHEADLRRRRGQLKDEIARMLRQG